MKKKNYINIILMVVCLSVNYMVSAQDCINEDEKEALVAILEKNRSLSRLNWDTKTPVKDWNGVVIEDCKVVGLDFKNISLSYLPDEIAYLEHLKYIRMYDVWFRDDKISRNLYTLPKLEELALIKSGLSELPELIVRLKNLKTLNISNNNFDTIPKYIFDLENLEHLNLSNNKYMKGTFFGLRKLKKLKSLACTNCEYIQFDDEFLKELPHLEVLKLSKVRNYKGSVDLSNQKKLKHLQLYDCNLKNLPSGFSNFTELEYLDLGYNYIPSFNDEDIKNLKKLRVLKIEKNDLTAIPNIKLALSVLDTLDISSNPIFKLTSEGISNLKLVKAIDIGNIFIDELPNTIEALKNTTYINVSKNNLTTLPESIIELKNLAYFDLHENKLTKLPNDFYKLARLKHLNLRKNELTELPSKTENLTQLEVLFLIDNKFTHIPSSIFELKNLTQLILDNNEVKKVPKELENLTKLKELYIVFEGDYDDTLCKLKSRKVELHYVYLNCKEDEDE